MTETITQNKPTPAFIGASWLALIIGVATYLIGLFNSAMELNEMGYYFTVLMLGLYGAISLQKTVRDRADGIPTTNLYYGITWFVLIVAISLLVIGLWNAGSIETIEKGFYALGFVLSLFAVVAVQKNVRDLAGFKGTEDDEEDLEYGTPPNPPL
ncbi:inner membrane protein YiaA [Enteractinococcus helveticum]|uniref:YiaAB two helix domain-containing protein n=1 Tax=Enteractinococcus helveticum TaxID=1837282 RepID=A0A1B7LY26_9MICC|nr:inner membrane protein YiaA [Enteractinococcus helveticum]OAV60199.1 hypothetical protein A6F49_12480 [Enteractinococcus helveticum]